MKLKESNQMFLKIGFIAAKTAWGVTTNLLWATDYRTIRALHTCTIYYAKTLTLSSLTQ